MTTDLNEIKENIKKCLIEKLNFSKDLVDKIDFKENFKDFDSSFYIDSLDLIEICMELESIYAIKIEDSYIELINSLEDLTKTIYNLTNKTNTF